MPIKYYQDIKRLRKEIRQADYYRRLYSICCNTYKTEISTNKKLETQLRNTNALDIETKPNMAFIFNEWINQTSVKSNKKKQEIIAVKLWHIASQHSITFFESRVDKLKEKNRLIKGFTTKEKKIEQKIDNLVKDLNNPKLKNISSSLVSTENLSIDYDEIHETLELTNNIKQSLQNSYNKTVNLSEVVLSDLSVDSQEGELLYKAFCLTTDIHPQLCAFKNKLIVHTNNRDVLITLDSLSDFLEKFINLLMIDWFQNNKIKYTVNHLRETLKSIDLLVIYLENKLNKINTELEIRRQTVNSLLSDLE